MITKLCIDCHKPTQQTRCKQCKRNQHHQQKTWRAAARQHTQTHNTCINCGTTHNLQAHHKTPVRLGGTNQPNNLTTLCQQCHTQYHGDIRANKQTRLTTKLKQI